MDEVRPGVTTCPECGNDVFQDVLGRPKVYCSKRCKYRVNNRSARQAWKDAKAATAAFEARHRGNEESPPR